MPGAQTKVVVPEVDEGVAAVSDPDVGEFGDLVGAAVEHHDRGASAAHELMEAEGDAFDLVAELLRGAEPLAFGDDAGEFKAGDGVGQVGGHGGRDRCHRLYVDQRCVSG